MKALLTSAVVAIGLASGATAQESHTVHFAPGTTGATIKGAITGDTYIDYRLSAGAGQAMDIILTGNPYFNVLPPGSTNEAIFIGSRDGGEYSGTLPTAGTYTVRIYQMGAAADEDQTNTFTLDIGID